MSDLGAFFFGLHWPERDKIKESAGFILDDYDWEVQNIQILAYKII